MTSQTYGKGLNFGAFRKACLSKFDESEDSRPHLDHIHVFFPNAADEEEEKQRKEVQGRTNPVPKEERMDISESLLFHSCV